MIRLGLLAGIVAVALWIAATARAWFPVRVSWRRGG